MPTQPKKKRRLVKGKDWHVWIPRRRFDGYYYLRLAKTNKPPKKYFGYRNHSEWVKVKLVEVK